MGRSTTAPAVPGGCFAYPVITATFLAWGDGNCSGRVKRSGYLYVFDTKKLMTVGKQAGMYNIRAAGDRLAWNYIKGSRGRQLPPVSHDLVVQVR